MNLFLSVCLIVKNEEKVLRRCLESIKGIADEIIIADTGSSDKSKEIAFEYTDKVYDYKWEDDFSKARNFAASKASGEWILVIDADEYVDRDSFGNFKSNFKKNPSSSNILSVQIVNFVGTNGTNTSLNYHERLYKNEDNIYYYRNIHELLKHKQSLEKRGIAELQIFHSGYMGNVVKEKNKSNRNMKLLKNKKEKDAIDFFFLGNEYFLLGDYEKAIANYKKSFQIKGRINYIWEIKLLTRLISCLRVTERYTEALEIIDSSEEIYTDLVDFKFLRAQIYVIMERDLEAANIFEEILLKKDELTADSSIDYLEYLPHKFLGELYEKGNKLHLAVEHYSKSLSINDSDDQVWVRLIKLLAKHSTLEELVQFLNNNCLKRKTMNSLRIIKILLSIPNQNVQMLTGSFLNDAVLSVEENQALLIKNLFLDGNNVDVLKILNLKHTNEISLLLSKGIFYLSDLILVGLITNDEIVRNILYNLKFDQSIENILNLLFCNQFNKLSLIEEDILVSIFKQAYVMQNEEVVKILNSRLSYLSIDVNKRLIKEIDNI
jgi:glycosyltransferase involved in cell wall biosynthesis